MDDQNYLLLLAIGTMIVLIDGQILYQSGKRYLADHGSSATGVTLARLVAVLFHLVALGVLALISTIDIGGTGIQAIVMRLGVVFLVVAVVHAAAIAVFARMRENEQVEQHDLRARAERERQALYDPVVAPVADQPGRSPEVSPGLDAHGPYSTSQ